MRYTLEQRRQLDAEIDAIVFNVALRLTDNGAMATEDEICDAVDKQTPRHLKEYIMEKAVELAVVKTMAQLDQESANKRDMPGDEQAAKN